MEKKNLGAVLALYPTPVTVVGAMVAGKPNWMLVAHVCKCYSISEPFKAQTLTKK